VSGDWGHTNQLIFSGSDPDIYGTPSAPRDEPRRTGALAGHGSMPEPWPSMVRSTPCAWFGYHNSDTRNILGIYSEYTRNILGIYSEYMPDCGVLEMSFSLTRMWPNAPPNMRLNMPSSVAERACGNIRGTSVEHVRNGRGTRSKWPWNTFEMAVEHVRNGRGTSVEHPWNIRGTSVEHPWNMPITIFGMSLAPTRICFCSTWNAPMG